jgi:cadmium resistance protein CadD (predicted permease)
VSSLPASAATAVALFAATNVDDLVVLALLTASSRASGRPRRWEIWAGQYLGFAVLVGLSLAAGRGLSLAPTRWLWLLALIPLAVGVVTLGAAIRSARGGGHSPTPPALDPPAAADPPQRDSTSDPPASPGPSTVRGVPLVPAVPGLSAVARLSWVAGAAGVATLTVVDGADNLAAYTPVFATADAARIAVTLAVFAVGVAVWCAAGALLTRHRRIIDTLARYGRWILPAAFILIALYTLHATNAPIHL